MEEAITTVFPDPVAILSGPPTPWSWLPPGPWRLSPMRAGDPDSGGRAEVPEMLLPGGDMSYHESRPRAGLDKRALLPVPLLAHSC